MIDLENESLLSLTEATRALPKLDGKRPHPSTLFRWMTDGIRGGVKLEHVRIGRRICTSREALQRFVEALSQAPKPEPAPAAPGPRMRTEKQRQRDVEKAKESLRAKGVL